MKKILFYFVFLLVLSPESWSQSLSFSYKTRIKERTENVFSIDNHNALMLTYSKENMFFSMGFEQYGFNEVSHRTDSFDPMERTLYGYFAKGNKNSYSLVTIGGGFKTSFWRYFNWNAGTNLGIAVQRKVESRLIDEEGNYLISFNLQGDRSALTRFQLNLFQSIDFEKSITRNVKFFIGFEVSTDLVPWVESDNLLMNETAVYNLFNTYSRMGITYQW